MRNQWDRSLAVGAVIIGALALLLGWLGISDATLPSEQIPYLASGGLLGIFLLGVGATLWLSADLRDEWRKLDEIHDDLRLAQTAERTSATSVDAQSNGVSHPLVEAAAERPRHEQRPIRVRS